MKANRLLRLAAGVLLAIGLAVHLAIGTMVGLELAGVGLAIHIAAAISGRRWWRQRQNPPTNNARETTRLPSGTLWPGVDNSDAGPPTASTR